MIRARQPGRSASRRWRCPVTPMTIGKRPCAAVATGDDVPELNGGTAAVEPSSLRLLDALAPLTRIVQSRDGGNQVIDALRRLAQQRRTLPLVGERLRIQGGGQLQGQ